MAAIESSEPGEEPGTCCLDTLKTSLSALPLFPTAEGPVNRHPAPHLNTGSQLARRRQYSRFRTIRLSGTAD